MLEEIVRYKHYTRESVVTKNAMNVYTVSFYKDNAFAYSSSSYSAEEAKRLAESYVYIGNAPTLLNENA
jgi:hypothetical protein